MPAYHKFGDNDVLVDVRHPDDQVKAPLNLPGAKILHIPFFSINLHLESTNIDHKFENFILKY